MVLGVGRLWVGDSNMAKYKLEYIWLDGYSRSPTCAARPKSRNSPAFRSSKNCPLWGFDGSSTQQAEGKSSDCVLKPVAVFPTAPARTACSSCAKS
jgi:glutamine synthetase